MLILRRTIKFGTVCFDYVDDTDTFVDEMSERAFRYWNYEEYQPLAKPNVPSGYVGCNCGDCVDNAWNNVERRKWYDLHAERNHFSDPELLQIEKKQAKEELAQEHSEYFPTPSFGSSEQIGLKKNARIETKY